MIFQHEERIFFFGGTTISDEKNYRLKNKSKLHELVICWDVLAGGPKSAEVRTIEEIAFQGHPKFMPNIPNKKYFENEKTWVFIDDEGGMHKYYLGPDRRTSYSNIKENTLSKKSKPKRY